MAALTPEFLFDLESNMRMVSAQEYQRLTSNLWWQRVARRMDSAAKKERINWLLDSAKITRTTKNGGQAIFEDIVSRTTEYESLNANAGLELKKEQLEDHDGNGVQLAGHWARQMGAYSAYWPQKQIADAIRSNPTTYDSIAFFTPLGAPHLVNPFDSAAGSFANIFTGAPSGIYPGALPVDISVTVDVAVQNINKALAYIASIKMPNGEDPRMLRLDAILHPPNLTARMQQITSAQFIAQGGTGGAGSGDVQAVIRNFGLGTPIEAPELGSAFGGSDTSYYLLTSEITSDELGAFVYVDREPFSIIMHGEMSDAELARSRKFQWTTEGRNVVGAGHPYLMFRADGT